jgi:hypothetical protein
MYGESSTMFRHPSSDAHIQLNGDWEFQLDPDGTLAIDTLAPDRTITVPLPWQAVFPELRHYSGYAWYRRTFTLDADFVAGDARLHFGAVDYWCEVWINGVHVGTHEGGYTPLSYLVGAHLRAGENTVVVRVYDSAQSAIVNERWYSVEHEREKARHGPPFDAQHVPHGKQEWYINVGGIWQDVTLTAVPATSIRHVHVTPDVDTSTATVVVALDGELGALGNATLRIAITDGDRTIASADVPLATGQDRFEATLQIPNAQLWTMDTPYLYGVEATVDGAGAPATHRTRFGMRSISFRDGQFLLNGQPVYLLSALDQDLYPDTIYTVPSEEFLRDQFRKAKELGLNSLRCHIKPPDPLYLDLADEMGLLIWAEIPSWRTFWIRGTLQPNQLHLPDELKARVKNTLTEMVERDFNHPSLMIWTIVNEDWGTSTPLNADDRQWLVSLYDYCKEIDPTRLVVDNSPCLHSWGPNLHTKSDIDDFHFYYAVPDQARYFVHAVEQLALRPLWTYSSNGDAQRRGDEPIVLSEFGNWGLPSLKALREYHGGEPHWFDLGPWWSRWEGEPGWPARVEERFKAFGLDALWPDYEAFATATQQHQYAAMKLEIETMRRLPTIAGYVITEFTDAYWESNGLLDFARNPKAYHDVFHHINSPDVVVALPSRFTYWGGETMRVKVWASHYSGTIEGSAELAWRLEGTDQQGTASIAALPRGATAEVTTLRLAAPDVATTMNTRLVLELRAGEHVVAQNTLDVVVYPAAARTPRMEGTVAVIGSAPNDPFAVDGAGQNTGEESADVIPAQPLMPMDAVGEPSSTAMLDGASGPTGGRRMLERLVAAAGYTTTARLDGASLAVASYPTPELLQWVRAGGDLLYLSDGPSPFFWIQSRGGAYSGNWVTSYSWLKPEPHPNLLIENPMGMAFSNIMPVGTILGVPMDDPAVQGDVLAGMVSGWVHHPAAHTVQFRYGEGRVIMTTFRLKAMLASDPTAMVMFHDLVEYLGSDRCQPTLRANY